MEYHKRYGMLFLAALFVSRVRLTKGLLVAHPLIYKHFNSHASNHILLLDISLNNHTNVLHFSSFLF